MPGAPPDTPAYYGHIETTGDALRVVYAARQGKIPRITRRLNESERKKMIRSGNVFVFSVEESGIKRWTDGRMWSPSRIVGNFLVYREMNERGQSRVRVKSNVDDTGSPEGGSEARLSPQEPPTFKVDGLLKKTITITINNSDLHLIAYFTQAEVNNGTLRRPTSSASIMQLVLPPQLFQLSNLRNPPKITTGLDGRTKIDDETDQELLLSSSSDRARRSWEEERPAPPLHTPRRSTISGVDRQLETSVGYSHRTQPPSSQNYPRPHISSSGHAISQGDSRLFDRYPSRSMAASSTSLQPATENWMQRGPASAAGYDGNRLEYMFSLDMPGQTSRWNQPTTPSSWSDYHARSGTGQDSGPSTQLLGSPPAGYQHYASTSLDPMPPSPMSSYHFDYQSHHHPYPTPSLSNVRPREPPTVKMESPQSPELYPPFQPTPSYTLAQATDMHHGRPDGSGYR